jgi:hypothetical protein
VKRKKGPAVDAINAILAAAAMNFQKLLGAFWRMYLRFLTRIWDAIPVLQATGTLHTSLVCA